MISFQYLEPRSLNEAFSALKEHQEDARAIAGGTALVNFLKNDLAQPKFLVGLRRLESLRSLTAQNSICIGSLVTLRTLETSALIAAEAPLLALACHHVATIRIRMMATLGGALAYADPSLDTPPALIASDAIVRIGHRDGHREIASDAFFTGIYETVLKPDELITEIVIPRLPPDSGVAFIKFLPATHDDYPTVSVAVRITLVGDLIKDVRIALGAVAFTPVRARSAEGAMIGHPPGETLFRDAAALITDCIAPMADFRGSAEYKRRMAVVHTRRALSLAAKRARDEQVFRLEAKH